MLEEGKKQAAMSQAKKIQQAEELHSSGQLTDAELEAMRIKIAVEEKFSKIQASGQESPAAKLAQEVQGK